LARGVLGCQHTQTRAQKAEEPVPEKEYEVKTIGDVTEVANASPTVVSGVGLVVGLEGTGATAPPGAFRTMLERELHKQKIDNVKQLLSSDETAMVLVTALIPPGAHKDDHLDVEVTLPPGSHVKSLRGGYLLYCGLFNYDTTKHLNPGFEGADRLLKGHKLAWAKGPLLVGFGPGDEAEKQKKGRIWGGGTSLIDRPFFLTLNNDQQFARIADTVAERINQTFHDDARKRLLVLGAVTDRIGQRFTQGADDRSSTTAKAVNREVVYVRLPWVYRLNAPRYLRVTRLIPLQDAPEVHSRYRHQLAKKLLDPKTTLSAALRLEALGTESIPTLQTGLTHAHPLVRFACAESLAYLGSPSAGEVLARTIKDQPMLRAYCLTALASLNEAVCHVRLPELLVDQSAQTRYGAFRALFTMDERDQLVKGEQLNGDFWLHRLAPQSPPLVHMTSSHRPEIVLFGAEPKLVPPFSIVTGEFTLTASAGDDRCTVARFPMQRGRVRRHQASLSVEDVLRSLADLGGTYPDAYDLLAQAKGLQCLSCPLEVDALPELIPVEKLAENATNPDFWKTDSDEDLKTTQAPAEQDRSDVAPGTAKRK
jgi:hypothetical protein